VLSNDTLKAARDLFPYTTSGRIYLNHAATSPLSARVVRAMSQYLHERSVGILETYPNDLELVRKLRSSLAILINAEGPERISLQASTSDSINLVAAGMVWKSGDRILSNDLEFPANVYPYKNLKRFGVELDTIGSRDGIVTPDMIEDALTPRTRLVALSAVQFLSGHRADLRSIGSLCRTHGVVFAVDAIQAVGAMKIDVQGMQIDALAAGAQKWQMGPHGTGFLYITEELQSQIHQQYLGWLSVQDPWEFRNYEQPLAASARRYEGGSLNFPGIHGYHASISTLLEFGSSAIQDHILDLTTILHTKLAELPGVNLITPMDRSARAGIVSIQLPSNIDDKRLLLKMEHEGITPALREGKIRFSPHFYNTPDEMERAVEATARCLRNP
jgi:selenocysteine lyase/cysteine desulfurase